MVGMTMEGWDVGRAWETSLVCFMVDRISVVGEAQNICDLCRWG